MTKEERESLTNDINYFEGVLSALRKGTFQGQDAEVLLALQQMTVKKGKEVQSEIETENKRLQQLIDKEQPKDDTRISTARPRRQPLPIDRSQKK